MRTASSDTTITITGREMRQCSKARKCGSFGRQQTGGRRGIIEFLVIGVLGFGQAHAVVVESSDPVIERARDSLRNECHCAESENGCRSLASTFWSPDSALIRTSGLSSSPGWPMNTWFICCLILAQRLGIGHTAISLEWHEATWHQHLEFGGLGLLLDDFLHVLHAPGGEIEAHTTPRRPPPKRWPPWSAAESDAR